MSSRKEAIRNRKIVRQRQLVMGGSILTALLLIIGTLFVVNHMNNTRTVTAMEKAMPTNSQAIFISESNEESWRYFNVLANSNHNYIPSVEKIGYAMVQDKPYLYLQGDTAIIAQTLAANNETPHLVQDNVVILSDNSEALVKDGLGTQEHYIDLAKKGSNKSFGYVKFGELQKGNDQKVANNLPHMGTWQGTFSQGKWDGTIDAIDNSSINKEASDTAVISDSIYRSFVDSINYSYDGNNATGSIRIESYNTMREPAYVTAMNWFSFDIKGNDMSFTLAQSENQ